jgi:hypothetical protein
VSKGENVIPFIIIVAATVLFFVLERVLPGRALPEAPGWYARAAFLNLCQLGVVLLAGVAWNRWFQAWSMLHLSRAMPPFLQGFVGWFIGTFVFYWWHRARHDVNFLWRVLHQVHHSPARIEMLTAFYKHPIEIAADSILASALMFVVLGASPTAGAWFNVFAVLGSIFITVTWVPRIGLDSSCNGPSITPSIINWMCMDSITGTSPGGIACSAPFEKQMASLPSAGFPTLMSALGKRARFSR